jgi:hypothetical protein
MKAIVIPNAIGRKTTLRRAKLRFFAFVAIAWSLLAAMGGMILRENLVSGEFSGLDLLACFLMVPEPLLIMLAVYFWVSERPRSARFKSIWSRLNRPKKI